MTRRPHHRQARSSPYSGRLKSNPGPQRWRAHKRCGTVIDVGAGIRPMQWYQPTSHVCIEPYAPYADILEQFGYDVVRGTACDALPKMVAEAVYMLDVIEHMEKPDGLRALALAQQAATKQVVVYTPLGFMEQHRDNWELGGDHWQRHRSGWHPDEFEGWHILPHGRRGFYALWQASTRS